LATSANPDRIWRFGAYEVDTRRLEVRRDGTAVKLRDQSFRILVYLVEHPGEIVTREELRQLLWPSDTFVDFDHSLNTAVMKLREALCDSTGAPLYIETIPKRGYRFIAPVGIGEASEKGLNGSESPVSRRVEGLLATLTAQRKHWPMAAWVGASVVLFAAVCIPFFILAPWRRGGDRSRRAWVQITHFPDGATSPALSPDGHMLAFIRGPETFVTRGQLYVKMLPDGEPFQLTHDEALKMAPAFSSDGSRIAYTITDISGWNTWVVPVLGGEPQELLPNAAALTWTDSQHVMFSELKQDPLMGLITPMSVATAKESRAGERFVYVPVEKVGMAHRSRISPDGKWILVSEMDMVGWRPCRVLPYDGSSSGEVAGPTAARCTYAGWSPDGKTMYFSADAGDGFHIWRQRFPDGKPEQMTFGATEEEGIAISPDGHTLITSAGIRESTVWVHDTRGDRQISGEGFATVPGLGFAGTGVYSVFSPDGKTLFYLVRKQGSRAFKTGELWMTDLASGRTEAALPGVSITEFDIAPDGQRVAFAALDDEGNSHVWVAPLDRHLPPKQISSFISRQPCFGAGGDIYFLAREGGQEFLYSVGDGDTAARKTYSELSAEFTRISPLGGWWISGSDSGTEIARSTKGGSAVQLCSSCGVGWGPAESSSTGKFLYIRFRKSGEMDGGETVVIGLPPGKELPTLPSSGLKSPEDARGLNVVAVIDMKDKAILAPGPDPSVYAYVRLTVQRNLFEIPLY